MSLDIHGNATDRELLFAIIYRLDEINARLDAFEETAKSLQDPAKIQEMLTKFMSGDGLMKALMGGMGGL